MHVFNLVGGLLFFCLSLFQVIQQGARAQVMASGQRVQVEVVQLPDNCEASEAFRHMHFVYRGVKNSIKISKDLCRELAVGQFTELIHSPAYPNLFLRPHTNPKAERVWWGALLAMSCYAMWSSSRQLYKKRQA